MGSGVAAESELRAALEQAFDYRGDVTITLKSGETVVGYVFDRRPGKSLADSFVRVLPQDSHQRRDIAYAEIAGAGLYRTRHRSGQELGSLGQKIQEKKAAGETNIGLHPDEHASSRRR